MAKIPGSAHVVYLCKIEMFHLIQVAFHIMSLCCLPEMYACFLHQSTKFPLCWKFHGLNQYKAEDNKGLDGGGGGGGVWYSLFIKI